MTITNYATKYTGAVDEKLTAESKSALCVNQDFSFVGAKTIKVYNIETSKMNDYGRSTEGTSRYGTVNNLNATEQEMTMTKDRSFTFSIDKMDEDETMGAMQAGTALARQLREVVIPEIDKYRYSVLVSKAGNKQAEALTKENIYVNVLKATEKLDEANIPLVGRFLIVSPATYSLIKQAKDFVLDTEIAQDMKIKGVVAMMDGMAIIKVPTALLPENVGFIAGHKITCTAPVKLAEYKVNTEPQGISGSLVEGRVYYDAFVLNNKKHALYVHTNA